MERWGRPVQNQSEKMKNLRLKTKNRNEREMREIKQEIKNVEIESSLFLSLYTN